MENPPLNTEFPYWVTQWGSGGIEQLASVVQTVNPPVILGFNEPDNPGQVITQNSVSHRSPTDVDVVDRLGQLVSGGSSKP